MKLVAFIIFISFVLENSLTLLISSGTLFTSLFVVTSLVLIYPFFNNKNNNYLVISFLIGLMYDFVYTDTLFLNALIFLILGLFVEKINEALSNNALNVMIMTFFTVSLYRILTYVVLLLVGYLNWDFSLLLASLYESYLANILYSLVMYLIFDYFSRKYRILKIDWCLTLGLLYGKILYCVDLVLQPRRKGFKLRYLNGEYET